MVDVTKSNKKGDIMKNIKLLLPALTMMFVFIIASCTADTVILGTYVPDIPNEKEATYKSITLKRESDRRISGSYVTRKDNKTHTITNGHIYYDQFGTFTISSISISSDLYVQILGNGKTLLNNRERYKRK